MYFEDLHQHYFQAMEMSLPAEGFTTFWNSRIRHLVRYYKKAITSWVDILILLLDILEN